MVIHRGDIVWADYGAPRGSEPAKYRPTVVMQDDWLLASNIGTAVVVPLTSNTALEAFPGNVLLPAAATGLKRDSVAVVSQLGPVSRAFIDPDPVSRVPAYLMREIVAGIRLVLGF